MKILFDQGTPAPLRKFLTSSEVSTAAEMGWSDLGNGELLAEAENAGFEILVTTDQNLEYQQNLSERTIGIVVIVNYAWPNLKERAEEVAEAIEGASPGCYLTL